MSDYIPKISYIGSSGLGVPEVLNSLNIRHFYNADEISLCFDRHNDLIIYDDTDVELEKKIKCHDVFGITHKLSLVTQHLIQKRQEQKQ